MSVLDMSDCFPIILTLAFRSSAFGTFPGNSIDTNNNGFRSISVKCATNPPETLFSTAFSSRPLETVFPNASDTNQYISGGSKHMQTL